MKKDHGLPADKASPMSIREACARALIKRPGSSTNLIVDEALVLRPGTRDEVARATLYRMLRDGQALSVRVEHKALWSPGRGCLDLVFAGAEPAPVVDEEADTQPFVHRWLHTGSWAGEVPRCLTVFDLGARA